MSKLQMIERKDGSKSYSVNIPRAHILDLKWEKGNKLSTEVGKVRDREVLIIFLDGDENAI